jgi:hypothetical protein
MKGHYKDKIEIINSQQEKCDETNASRRSISTAQHTIIHYNYTDPLAGVPSRTEAVTE